MGVWCDAPCVQISRRGRICRTHPQLVAYLLFVGRLGGLSSIRWSVGWRTFELLNLGDQPHQRHQSDGHRLRPGQSSRALERHCTSGARVELGHPAWARLHPGPSGRALVWHCASGARLELDQSDALRPAPPSRALERRCMSGARLELDGHRLRPGPPNACWCMPRCVPHVTHGTRPNLVALEK